jgi:hypothetical protein
LPDIDLTKFQQKLAERRAKQAEEEPASNPTEEYADLVPEQEFERSEEDLQMDKIIDNIDILDAYRRWCGKMVPQVKGNQREGIKISCPIPGHADKDPSAWINLDKQTWFCGGCQVGGDSHDLAAYSFGYPVPGYKTGAEFHKLRRQMAESLGYSFIKPPGAESEIAIPPAPEPVTVPGPVSEPIEAKSEPVEDNVIELYDTEDEIEFPTLDWRQLVDPETFLDIYMRQTVIDDVPEEYNFWNGMLALGMVCGRDVTLYDRIPVYGNLFLCLLGHTGDGKSRAFRHLKNLLSKVMPFKWDDPTNKGCHWVMSPGSAEALIYSFDKPVVDPTNPKVIAYHAPVRGVIEFNELSSLTGRTARQGNVLKPTLMEFYDMAPVVATTSMSTGKKEAHQPFASVFTTTQPRALRDLIRKSDADSGFLNRWIFASGKAKQRIAIGGVKIDTDPAVKPLEDILGWVGFGKDIQWSTEAMDIFTDFFHKTLHLKQINDDSGLLVRMDLLFKKLILLLTVNRQEDIVQPVVVERVLGMYNYLIAAYAIPAQQIGNTVALEIQEELLRHCKRITEKTGKGPTIRELGLRIKTRKYPSDLVLKSLDFLVKMGLLELDSSHTTKGGRPSVRYRYVG